MACVLPFQWSMMAGVVCVSQSSPYFHDGSIETLEEAVRFMATGGVENQNRSPMLFDRSLTDDQIADITAFLGSLDCGQLEQPELP